MRYSSIIDDYNKVVAVVRGLRGKGCELITVSLVRALVVGEDHRSALHYGVDPLAIVRAIKVRMVEGKRQGASTVEQQLVRVVTERFERTLRRKLREQILAVMLASTFSKNELARSYLKVAYYGVALIGVQGVERLRFGLTPASDAAIIAHLKYPRSLSADGDMAAKHSIRVSHINLLLTDRRFTCCLAEAGLTQ
ncbi:biosynthetic peptidoglycan transglycosylase [Pseudomonas putida]|uniref:biosynthetic peptidoglycan transglycosylase n=1 Tax=Pseudomonas putida TaxID=303 RepID=UPI0013748079|nr:biosynthetic peptidoglycan transglycosylase [Pseudomonas putida]